MSGNRLDKSLIRNPRQWKLYIAPGAGELEVMAYNPIEDNSLLHARLDYDAEQGLRALEDVIYDNPLLLSDFKEVTFLVRDTPHAIIPTKLIADDQTRAHLVIDELIGKSLSPPIIDDLPLLDASVAYRIKPETLNFLNRTFPGARFIHRLSALTRYWHGSNRGAGASVTHVNVRSKAIDIVVFSGNRLQLANSYHTPTATDALYYIMAVRDITEATPDTNVVITGDKEFRNEIAELLAGRVDNVVPAVFPAAMFRAGGQTAMNTPLDLVVLPLL